MINTATSKNNSALSLWDKIEIIIEQEGNTGEYVTRVEDINGNVITASKPEFAKGSKLLTAGARVYVRFFKPDAIYGFSAIIRPIQKDPTGLVKLYVLGGLERVQRRNFVRIDLKVHLKYALFKGASSRRKLKKPCWKISFSRNISAGGMLMKVEDDVKKDDILLVRVDNCKTMGIPRLLAVFCCRVININDTNFAGVEFIRRDRLSKHFTQDEIEKLPSQVRKFNVGTQNKLVRFVLDKQVEERRKGLI
ncbi:MAG: flagellar brake domain-containing protein [Candidatus Zixiibacteriota bacterium]|nr:MAG: flagellar brake domain-containing protein [candidate division Zixibacteria bacterium]